MSNKNQNSIDLRVNDSNPEITLVAGSIKGAMKSIGAGSRDLWFAPRAALRVIPGFNVRVKNEGYFQHIRGLADSMKIEGFKPEHPIAGYVAREGENNVIYVYDGHCRIDGVDLANKEGAEIDLLPVVISTKARDQVDLTVSLVRNNAGKPLDALEKAAVCKRLVLFGKSEDEIAQRLGFSSNYVRDLLTLIGAPECVRLMVAEGTVSATTAIQSLVQFGDKAPLKLKEGLEKAQATGKAKVTNRFLADPTQKWVKKNAGGLFTVVNEIKADPAFVNLSTELREKLETLLNGIDEAKKKADAKNSSKAEAKSEAAVAA